MATFKALNIESDEESDEEIDNTKEIQIEDALKLYQTALKYHSSDKTLDQAGGAYKELFESDIFKFPESQSEYNRIESIQEYGGEEGSRIGEAQDSTPPNQNVADNAPSTLPQILHLSYKNRAEYELDLLRVAAENLTLQDGNGEVGGAKSLDVFRQKCQKALEDFAEALDKDENDSDLWRRASRISETLGSLRAFRFCLEAALGGDEEDTDDVLGLRNVEAQFDGGQLAEMQRQIQDDVSLVQNPSSISDSKALPPGLKKQLALYPFLAKYQQSGGQHTKPERVEGALIEVPEKSLDAVGLALLQRIDKERNGYIPDGAGSLIRIRMPASDNSSGLVLEATHLISEKTNSHQDLSTGQDFATSAITSPNLDKSPQDAPRRERQDSVRTNKDSIDLPTRKRSTEVAELPETADGERARSKRIRNRQSNAFERDAVEPSVADKLSGQDQRIKACIHADRWIFDHVRALARRFGATVLSSSDDIRSLVMPETSSKRISDKGNIPLQQAIRDFYAAMLSWTSQKTHSFLRRDLAEEAAIDTSNAGLSNFLDMANTGSRVSNSVPVMDEAQAFADIVNRQSNTAEMTAILWIQFLTTHHSLYRDRLDGNSSTYLPSYVSQSWSEVLKTTVVQTIIAVDEALFEYLICAARKHEDDPHAFETEETSHAAEFAQVLFELHLDIYTRITNPASKVPEPTRDLERARLDKFCNLARDLLSALSDCENERDAWYEDLVVRHTWASVFQLQSTGEISREQLITCIEDLKQLLQSRGLPMLKLPNNAAMPEISPEAAQKEISKLETMDFFLSIFHKNDQHPVDLIERLEPVLMSTMTLNAGHNGRLQKGQSTSRRSTTSPELVDEHNEAAYAPVHTSSQRVLSEFVAKSNASLRLSLWHRLCHAYQSLGIHTKVLSINLHVFDLIIGELESSEYLNAGQGERENQLLMWLHELEKLILGTHEIVSLNSDALECLDDSTIRSFLNSLSYIWTLLHAVALYDDFSQISQKGPPLTNPFRAYPSESFHPASIKLHEMQLRSIILMYSVLVEAMNRHPEKYPEGLRHRHEYLSYVHYALGMRRLCKASDNLFLKFMSLELRDLASRGRPISEELAQVLYDLYDLHLFSTPNERQDHGCEADYLDRTTALDLIDLVLERARNVNMKDMHKIELGKTVEKLQTALGAVKSTNNTLRNRKIFNAFIKSPIDPTDTFQSLRGVGSISATPVNPDEVPVASKGWYQLIPQITLAKYRRTEGQPTSGAADELQAAVAFLVHDLEYDMEKWDTWLCLANAHDFLTDEAVLWSAEKINTGRNELIQMQRASIHAYTMALASGIRTAQPCEDTRNKFAELYADFGVRMYSSSRPPFSMQVFEVDSFLDKHYSGQQSSVGLNLRTGTRGMRLDQALRFACVLFRKAITLRPNNWMTQFMLGKCLWKMYTQAGDPQDLQHELANKVLKAFQEAVEKLPQRKDPAKHEPTLEPIYKVVFVVHKLVTQYEYGNEKGADVLNNLFKTQKQFDVAKMPVLAECDTWNDYMIELLKILRASDKSKWHHRIVFKMAQILYEKHGRTPSAAQTVKEYLLDQHMFSTKTLALTVWKPKNERAGRHWIYMTRYAQFLAQLLDETDDVESMRILARRVRKKNNEFYDHQDLWEHVCNAHLRLHRRTASIGDTSSDEQFKAMTRETFDPRAALVDAWCQSPSSTHPLLDILREVSELKKFNASLINPRTFDDLLADTYAAIFIQILPTLGEPFALAPAPSSTARKERDNTATPVRGATPSVAGATPERSNKMALDSLMNLDGSGAGDLGPSGQAAAQILMLERASEVPTRSRLANKAVTKKDILKHATEAAISKAVVVNGGSAGTAAATAVLPAAPATGKSAGEKRASNASVKTPGIKGTDGSAKIGGGGGGGSDADSELSEQPEDLEDPSDRRGKPTPKKRINFPNLVLKKNGEGNGDGENDDNDDDNGEDSFRTANEEEGDDDGGGDGGVGGERAVGDEEEPVSPLTTVKPRREKTAAAAAAVADSQEADAAEDMDLD